MFILHKLVPETIKGPLVSRLWSLNAAANPQRESTETADESVDEIRTAGASLITLYASQRFPHLLPFLSLPHTDYSCSGMLGMVSGQISDAQISASSYADRGWVAENARLLTGRSGWTGQQTKQPFRNEWLQVGSRPGRHDSTGGCLSLDGRV